MEKEQRLIRVGQLPRPCYVAQIKDGGAGWKAPARLVTAIFTATDELLIAGLAGYASDYDRGLTVYQLHARGWLWSPTGDSWYSFELNAEGRAVKHELDAAQEVNPLEPEVEYA